MKTCKNCRNGIPDGMKICPHCGKLPPQLFPNFYLYLVLTAVAVASAVCFRPFSVGKFGGQLSSGMLWVSFCVFVIFALIFASVCLVVYADCKRAGKGEKLSRAEITRFKNMRRHIAAGRHYYANDEFCTVCGHRRSKKK